MLVLVALIEITVAVVGAPPSAWSLGHRFYPATRIPTVEESVVQWQLDRLRTAQADVVLLGDSSAMNGLVPAAFEEITGLPTQNFASICWVTVDGHADVLELYLRTHGAPRVVVYQMATLVHVMPQRDLLAGGFYDQLGDYIGTRTDRWPVPLPSLQWRRLARDVVDGQQFAAAYTNAPRGRELSDADLAAFLSTNHGFNIDRAPRPRWDDVVPILPLLQPEALAGLIRLFELSEAWGFDLYVVHNPMPELIRHPELEARYAAVERVVSAAAEPYARVNVIGPFGRWFRNEAFANVEHLTPEGAWSHSQTLARFVGSRLAAASAE